MNGKIKLTILVILIVSATIGTCSGKKKNQKATALRQTETDAVNFVRLIVMRLIYGIATRIGLGDRISEAFNGAFVPPGVDDEYADFDREYDYDDY